MAIDTVVVLGAGAATALATGVGAIPVFLLGRRAGGARPFIAGAAIGVMVVASIVGLLAPALRDGSVSAVVIGVVVGGVFVAVARGALSLSRARARFSRDARRSILVFAVLFVHSLPEGFAVGAAWASTTAGLSTFVVLAIAIQNIPEGTAVAAPMQEAGYSPLRQVAAAIASSAPQPVGAVAAFLLVEQVEALLPVSLAFAAGAMLMVVAIELIPSARRHGRGLAFAGAASGGAVMVGLSAALGV